MGRYRSIETRVTEIRNGGHDRAVTILQAVERRTQLRLGAGRPAHQNREEHVGAPRRLARAIEQFERETVQGLDRETCHGPTDARHEPRRDVLPKTPGRHHHPDGLGQASRVRDGLAVQGAQRGQQCLFGGTRA